MSDPSCLAGFLSCMSHPVFFRFCSNATAAEQNGPEGRIKVLNLSLNLCLIDRLSCELCSGSSEEGNFFLAQGRPREEVNSRWG